MRLVSHVGRAIRKSGRNTTEFARESGIARSTLEKLIGNHFSEIRRDTIERLAARLQIDDITELFTLQRDERQFLNAFSMRRSVTFVFGTHDVTDAQTPDGRAREAAALRTTLDLWDFRAQAEFLSFLRSHVPDVRDEMLFFSRQSFGDLERQQVIDLVKSHNTVIVGSPKVNPACEAVLCALYRGSKPGAGTKESGPVLRLSEDHRLRDSILSVGGFDKKGVVDARKGKLLAPVHFAGPDGESQDAGILFTAYRPLGTNEEVTLVIAAGISGCGTYGALRSLVDDPPDAKHVGKGLVAERAVSTTFRKPTASLRDDRQVVRVVTVG